MKWALIVMQLLPTILQTVEAVGGHLQGHEKKAAAVVLLNGIANGVATASPEHAEAAQLAAKTAAGAIDGVVATLNAAGVFNHGTAKP